MIDQVNAAIRLVSPQGFAAGRLANLSPEQSSLNKPLYGVVGSQKLARPVQVRTPPIRLRTWRCCWVLALT